MVKVKKLEWYKFQSVENIGQYSADTIVGEYYINIDTCGNPEKPWEVWGLENNHSATFATVDEAKAAAQADYEKLILSALETQ